MQNRIVTEIPARLMLAEFHGLEKANKRVAAYARVSTDHEEQETSLAAQTEFYRKKILEHPGWAFVDIYVDEGISGLTTKKRDGFNRLVADCLAGRIDLVLTKSISRFARNTVDSITTIRKLKAKGVGVYFEKENIFTMDSKGEFLLTVMSSIAQEESRSISENVVWGQRKRLAGRAEFPGRYSGVSKLSSKVVCGVCGSGFTPRPWHSTTDNTLVWQCRNKIKKGPKCQTSNLYDRMLHYVIHDAARTLALKRKVTQTVVEIVTGMTDEAACEMVRRWMDAFEKRDIWEMQSDEEDLSMILRRIEVLPEGKLKIQLPIVAQISEFDHMDMEAVLIDEDVGY